MFRPPNVIPPTLTPASPAGGLPSPWKGEGNTMNDLCASIEHAIVDVLVQKSLKAVAKYQPKSFILAGGVAANKNLRESLKTALPKSTRFLMPDKEFCMDNAAMIAVAGYFQAKQKKFIKYDKLKANANWELV